MVDPRSWFRQLAQHPIISGGTSLAVATFAAGIESDAPWFALSCFAISWTILAAVLCFKLWKRTHFGSLGLIVGVGLALGCYWFWHFPQPPPPQASARDIASEIVKTLPMPTPEPSPDLKIRLGSSASRYNATLKRTELLLEVEIRNAGAPSAVTGWHIHYRSPILERDLNPVKPLLEPMLFPLSKNGKLALKFYYSRDAINEKVTTRISKEEPATNFVNMIVGNVKKKSARL
jgi:hypothetical protein